MNNMVFINGRFLPANKAVVSIFDRGFMYGDGLFETMRSYNGMIFALDLHLDRLIKSSKTIQISLKQSKKHLSNCLKELLELNKLTIGNAYVKLIVTRGIDYGMLLPSKSSEPTMAIITKSLDEKRIRQYQRKGIGAVFLSGKIRPLPHIKSLNLMANIAGLIEANQRKMQEGIFTAGDKILEGAVTNIFVSDGKCIKTPPIEDGILPGITRRLVIDLAKKDGIKIIEASLSKKDLENSSESFLSNSIMEIAPLIKIENKTIARGKAGTLTRRLQQAYKQMVLMSVIS